MALHPKVLFLLKGMDPAIERWWTLNRDPSQIVWPQLEKLRSVRLLIITFFPKKKKKAMNLMQKKAYI